MHVAFDMDGVLLDSESDLAWLHRALEDTMAAFDIESTQENIELLYPAGLSRFEEAAEALNIPKQELWETRNEYYNMEKISAIESGEIGPFDDVDALYDLGGDFTLSIISNSPQNVVETFVEVCDLESLFVYLVGRANEFDAINRLKPDPHMYEQLHREMAAEEYVYVGHNDSDETFARETGMDYVDLDRERGPIASLYDVVAEIRERDRR